MSTAVVQASSEVLNSWKEIASYMNRGVRTVQRWEAELNLPVRRPHGRGRSAVVAIRSELDLWLKACPVEKRNAEGENGQSLGKSRRFTVSNGDLVLEGQRLRQHVANSRLQVSTALVNLVATLERMAAESSKPKLPKFRPPDTQSEAVVA